MARKRGDIGVYAKDRKNIGSGVGKLS